MKSFIFYYIFLFFFLIQINSQTGNSSSSIKENFEEGEYFFNREEYEDAISYYLKLIEEQPDNSNFNFKIGESYLNIPGKETLAITYLEKAVKNITEKNKYRKNSYLETKAPLHAYFYLGNAYRYANELDKALESYQTFVTSPYYFDNYNIAIVENEIKACERAKIIKDNPVLYDEVALNENINTDAAEYLPVVSGNEQTLVFVRKLKFYDAIFYCKKNGPDWDTPVNINPQIRSDGDFYPSSLSFNGDELYLIKETNGNKDIYISRLVDGFWSKAEKLDKINTLSNESHASLSEDGCLMFISSDRNVKTGSDIYVFRKKGTSWTKPKNLGKIVNSKFDDISPFITNQGKMLFFCSKGHDNMGGYDIFYSLFENKKWSIPVNIGYPINSTSDNNFFMPVSGNKGYISKTDNSGSENIYIITFRSYIPKY